MTFHTMSRCSNYISLQLQSYAKIIIDLKGDVSVNKNIIS